MIRITRRLEFDAGHRIPNHNGKCINLHGHRYAIELTVTGVQNTISGSSDEGMVLDFSQIKKLAQKNLVNKWDHAFFVYRGDKVVMDFLSSLPWHKTVILDYVPTVENLSKLAYYKLAESINSEFEHLSWKVFLENVRIYETPNSWADFGVAFIR